ncbi:protein ybeL [Salmonella enterica subsp. enterica]|uniref:Protein ybeL n=1 Tax=Salmonella enterica I TaxID=59201 RepID=A0A3S4I2S0_SALET|nr:protein ybeL [Salmonella enterica subsp. enterica]
MNKVAQYYRELVASLSERLRNGERDIDALVEQARQRVMQTGELTRTEVDETDARCQTRSGRVRHELRREPGR